MKLPECFERYRTDIDAELKLILSDRQLPLYDMMRYHLGWIDDKGNILSDAAGKALRPTLCLSACEVAGGEYSRALSAAAAIELVHNYSLIHDDIQDDDRERRHRPTVWYLWGKPQAINAGTAMRLLANIALLRLEAKGVSQQKRQRIQQLLDETSLRLIEGQYLDINFETRFDINISDYLTMIEKKTAALIACSLEVGALLGSDDDSLADKFNAIGRNLGLAFQIIDDILGIWGEEKAIGKPLGSDIRRRKKTYPIIYVLGESDDRLRQRLIKVYSNGNNGDIDEVLQILESVNARSHAQQMAEQYCRRAMNDIDSLPVLQQNKQLLKEMAEFLVKRNF
jgi:geranylgeranyl diphosphate synthase type I